MTDYLRDLRASVSTSAATADADEFGGGAIDFLNDMEQAGAAAAAEAAAAAAAVEDIPEEDDEDEEEDVNAEDGDLCEDTELASAAVPAVRFVLPTLSFGAAAPAPSLIPSLASSMQRRSSMPSATAAGNAVVESAVVLPLQKVAGGAKRVANKVKAAKAATNNSAANAPAAGTKKSAPAAALQQGSRPLRGQSVYIGKPAATKRNGPSAREIAQERAGILTKNPSTSSLHADEPLSARGKENPAANGGDVSARRTGATIVSRYMKSASCATTNSHVIEKMVHLPPQPLTARVLAATAAAAASSSSGAATARRSSMTDVASFVATAARSTAHAGKRRSAAMDHASAVPSANEAPIESNEGSASKKARHDGLELMARAPFCSPVAESPSSGNADPMASPEVTAVISRKLSFTEGADEAPEIKMTDAVPIDVSIVAMQSEERDQFVSALAAKDAALAAKDAEVAMKNAELAAKDAALATLKTSLAGKDAELATKDASLTAKDAELATLRAELAASVSRASELETENGKNRVMLTEAWDSEKHYKTLYQEHGPLAAALEAAKAEAAQSTEKWGLLRGHMDKLQKEKHVLMARVKELEKKSAASSGAGDEWGAATGFNFDAAASASAGIETRRSTMAVTHSVTGLLSKRK